MGKLTVIGTTPNKMTEFSPTLDLSILKYIEALEPEAVQAWLRPGPALDAVEAAQSLGIPTMVYYTPHFFGMLDRYGRNRIRKAIRKSLIRAEITEPHALLTILKDNLVSGDTVLFVVDHKDRKDHTRHTYMSWKQLCATDEVTIARMDLFGQIVVETGDWRQDIVAQYGPPRPEPEPTVIEPPLDYDDIPF